MHPFMRAHGCSALPGVTNLEGGCYAKVAHLLDAAPDVAAAIRFGALLENVVYDPASRQVDYADT